MASESKSKNHSERKSPSPYSPASPSYSGVLNLEPEVERRTDTATNHDFFEESAIEPPEVESLIHKLQRFSISPQRSDKSQGNVTSQYNPAHPLTRLQSEKLGIQPTELPLPTRKRARKSPKGSDSETLSSSSSISNTSSRSQPPTPPLQITVHQSTQYSTSPSQNTISSSSQSQIYHLHFHLLVVQ